MNMELIPVQLSHAESMYRWMCDPTIRNGIGLRSEPSREKTRSWIHTASADPTIRAFAILFQRAHVGNVVLDRLDSFLQTARLSIYIGEPATRGRGLGRRAIEMVAAIAFGEMDLNKLWLTVHVENHPAIATYLKVGFVLEGILRDEFILENRRIPALYMGLLRNDFKTGTSEPTKQTR